MIYSLHGFEFSKIRIDFGLEDLDISDLPLKIDTKMFDLLLVELDCRVEQFITYGRKCNKTKLG